MRRRVLIALAVLAVIAAAVYAADAMDLVGMIMRSHGGGMGHSG
jgi:hypothetical protein